MDRRPLRLFPRARRLGALEEEGPHAGAISGYITGNLAISLICGVVTFVVLLILGMPYAAPLALLVAVLDLIPLVGATLGRALLVVVGLFVEPLLAAGRNDHLGAPLRELEGRLAAYAAGGSHQHHHLLFHCLQPHIYRSLCCLICPTDLLLASALRLREVS
jgi:hypothetical protein